MAAKTIRAPFPPDVLTHSLSTLESKPAMAGQYYWSRSTANGPLLILAQTDTLARLITTKTPIFYPDV